MSNKHTFAAISFFAALLSGHAVLAYDKTDVQLAELDCRAPR